MMRHQPNVGEFWHGVEGTMQESEQARIAQITADSFERTLAAILAFRKKSTGIGHYRGTKWSFDLLSARFKEEQPSTGQPIQAHSMSHATHKQQLTRHFPTFCENCLAGFCSADLQAQ